MSAPAGPASLAAAIARAAGLAQDPGVERVPLDRLAGRMLAEGVRARAPLPPATQSAMDGWAVRARDLPGRLPVAGESAAGHPFPGALPPGAAVRISTGAVVPDGADAVVRSEEGVEEGGALVAPVPVAPGRDVRRAGEDLGAGDEVLPAGTVVSARHVGLVAACGHAWAACRARPRVAIVVTGDELVPPGSDPSPGTVFESNLPGLAAMAQAAGAEVVRTGRVGDDAHATLAALGDALALAPAPHLLVTAGGAARGRHDHVRAALAALSARAVVDGLRVRPGRPTWLGTARGVPVLALPGNPVAAALVFHVLGRVLLGHPDPFAGRLPPGAPVAGREGEVHLVRSAVLDGRIVPVDRQGPADVSSLARAGVVAWIEGARAAGDLVAVSRW